jgi:hypothetical protein
MAMTERIAATTSASTSAAFSVAGPTVIAITGGVLQGDESVTVWGEDAAGTFNDLIYQFPKREVSVLIETYRDVKVQKSATATALAIDSGA